jgi:ABC-type microcin C transport system duplicated ATPase subunit YejF
LCLFIFIAARVRGSVRLRDFEALSATEKQLERIRGAEISLVFEDPLLALNPVLRVRDQVVRDCHFVVRDSSGRVAGGS